MGVFLELGLGTGTRTGTCQRCLQLVVFAKFPRFENPAGDSRPPNPPFPEKEETCIRKGKRRGRGKVQKAMGAEKKKKGLFKYISSLTS